VCGVEDYAQSEVADARWALPQRGGGEQKDYDGKTARARGKRGRRGVRSDPTHRHLCIWTFRRGIKGGGKRRARRCPTGQADEKRGDPSEPSPFLGREKRKGSCSRARKGGSPVGGRHRTGVRWADLGEQAKRGRRGSRKRIVWGEQAEGGVKQTDLRQDWRRSRPL